MKSNLFVAVMPEPGNQGEDLNWVEWMVIAHEEETAVQGDVIDPIIKAYFATIDNEEPDEDATEEEWGKWEDRHSAQLFLDYMDGLGYTVFPPTHLSWCAV